MENNSSRKVTLEYAIYKNTGVLIRDIPADGKSRKLKASGKEWRAISFGDYGMFGCVNSGEIHVVSGGKLFSYRPEPVKQKARLTKTDREIIAIGNSMQDHGQKMSEDDLDQYIAALAKSIAASGVLPSLRHG